MQVGFVVGPDGIMPFLQQCLTEPWFMLGTSIVCFSAVHIMFELRIMNHRSEAAASKADSLKFHASSQLNSQQPIGPKASF